MRSCTDTTAPARLEGGTTKFVPCTTSTSPMNHSIGGVAPRPHRAWSGRAGIGRCAADTLGGKQVVDPRPPAPTDGEGTHVELGSLPQRAQRTEAEDADAGPMAEERSGVECHREACRADRGAHILVVLGTDGALHMAHTSMAPL